MRTRKSYLAEAVACAVAVNVFAGNALAQQVPDREESIEKVVVVGEKIERTLKDTTSSISVINEDELSSMRYKSVQEAISEVPNVVALSGAMPDIRGVSGNGAAGGFNSISGGAKGRVTTLVDGVAVPFVADRTGDSSLWDIQQIEVYRGPQSTSNGRNSIAGALYIKTKDPTQYWEGAVRLGYRNQDRYLDTSAVLSGPIIEDKLAFRLSAQRVDGDTITDDTGFASNPPDYDLDKIETTNLRTKLLWTPIDDLALTFSHSRNNEQGDAGRIYYAADTSEQYSRLFFRDIETDVVTNSLHADYVLNDSMSVDVLVAVMDYEWGFDSYEPDPAAQQQLLFDESNITVDMKLNFGVNNNTASGFVGLAYFERDHDVVSMGAYPYQGDDKSDSLAVYGEFSYALSPKLNLVAGARLERESQIRNFVMGAIDSVLDNETDIFLPKLVLQYAVNDSTTLSVSARKGYNAAGGALNFTAQQYYYYDEEKVNTYELSSRSSFANNDVFLRANLFYNDYQGYQALSSTRFITNIDDVATYGAELELTANVTADVQLNAGLGLLHTEITNAGEEYPEVDGNELNSAPEITANIGAKYWLTDTFNIGVSANYVDDYFGDFTNTPERIAGDYALVRLSADYEIEAWRISAFVNNALDKEALLSQEPASPRYPQGYIAITDPRNLGLSVTYQF